MVYVDNMLMPFRGMKMSHMFADTTEELNNIAGKIGLKKEWIQKQGTAWEHYDVSISKRKLAIQYGAQEIDFKKAAAIIATKIKNGGTNNERITKLKSKTV